MLHVLIVIPLTQNAVQLVSEKEMSECNKYQAASSVQPRDDVKLRPQLQMVIWVIEHNLSQQEPCQQLSVPYLEFGSFKLCFQLLLQFESSFRFCDGLHCRQCWPWWSSRGRAIAGYPVVQFLLLGQRGLI